MSDFDYNVLDNDYHEQALYLTRIDEMSADEYMSELRAVRERFFPSPTLGFGVVESYANFLNEGISMKLDGSEVTIQSGDFFVKADLSTEDADNDDYEQVCHALEIVIDHVIYHRLVEYDEWVVDNVIHYNAEG